MLIGIISDTHDNVKNIKKAVQLFKERKVDLVIHCGDVVAPASMKFFEGLKIKFVKGNCDGDIMRFNKLCEQFGFEFYSEKLELELSGKKIGVYHGDDSSILNGMINSKKYDYILTGHTHQAKDETIGETRILNPGGHYFGGSETIAFLDLEKDVVEFVELK